MLRPTFFASGFPITSVCERSLDVIVCQSSNHIFNYYDAYFQSTIWPLAILN